MADQNKKNFTEEEIASLGLLRHSGSLCLLEGKFLQVDHVFARRVFVCESLKGKEADEVLLVPIAMLLTEEDLASCRDIDSNPVQIHESDKEFEPYQQNKLVELPMAEES